MNRYFLMILCITAFWLPAFGQSVVTVSTAQPGNVTKEVKARDEVRLLPGFSVKPTDNNSYTVRIDETLQGEFVNTPEFAGPDARTLDTKLAVGSAPGYADVSPTGGAIYHIPVALPEGVGGMTPQLAVTFNSQGRNGTMGTGWSLSGLSAITRTGRTIYHDGTAGVMELDLNGDDDRLMLDGQRLISDDSAKPGLEATKYHTENENYATITKEASYASRWFKTVTKDGKTVEYGKTPEARTQPVNGHVAAWWINRVTDPYGNFINYIYHRDGTNGEQYIQKIEYGYGTTVVGAAVFGYDKRSDLWKTSVRKWNYTLAQTVLLKQITVYAAGNRVGKYVFNYSLTDDGISKLTEVKQENGKGERLNSTFFTWKGPTVNMDANGTAELQFTANNEYIPVDLDGDGITDILKVPKNDNQWTLYRGTYGGTQFGKPLLYTFPSTDDWIELKNSIISLCNLNSWTESKMKEVMDALTKAQGYSIGDFDGDGVAELAVMTFNYNLNAHVQELRNYLTGQTPSFSTQGWNIASTAVTLYKYTGTLLQMAQKEFAGQNTVQLAGHSLDFNHNGKANLLVESSLYEYNNTTGNIDNTGLTSGYHYNDPVLWGDFNGDGRLDYATVNGKMIFLQNKDNYKFSLYKTFDDPVLAVVDIDSDGISELLMRSKHRETGYRYIADNQGDYVILPNGSYVHCPPAFYNNPDYNPYWPSHPTLSDRYRQEYYDNGYRLWLADYTGTVTGQLGYFTAAHEPTHAIVADIDADGVPDLLICRRVNTNGNVFAEKILYRIRANSQGTGYTWLTKNGSLFVGDALPGDFDGDGIVELLNTNGLRWKFASGNPGHLMASATNGYNQKTLFEYAPLTNSAIYTKGSETWPTVNFAGPLHAVKTVKQDNGLAGQTAVNYAYAGGKIHTQGKGFMGFSTITANNASLGMVTKTVNTFDTDRGAIAKTVTSVTRGGKTAETANTFVITPYSSTGKRFYSHLGERKETDMDGNTVTTTYTVNNATGNTTKELTDYGGGLTITVNYSDFITGFGYPKTVQTVRKHPDDNANFTTKTAYEYNDRGKIVKKTENDQTTDKKMITEYTAFDTRGNPAERKISGHLVDAVVETMVYDATKRFVTKITATATDLTPRVSEFTHDLWGRTLTQKGFDGLTVTSQYDGWGRLQKTVYPDGTSAEQIIQWDGAAGNYKVTAKATGQAQVVSKYDAAGRERESETAGAKATAVKTVNAYEINGQLKTVTTTIDGQTTSTAEYAYHADGRLKDETVNGVKTSYAYDKQKVTATKNGKSTVKTFDGWGNVKQTTDRMGYTVVFNYHSSGQPKMITAAGANYGMKYDNAGNQTELQDPNAGTVKYTQYDGMGRVRKQEDAKGKIQTAAYDAWGQLYESKLGAATTAYAYNDKGWLTGVTGPGGNAAAYTYDSYGRPLKETLTIIGEGNFETAYSYNSHGKIATVTYPGGVKETRSYDAAAGNLDKVEAGSAVVWQLSGVSATQTTSAMANGAMTAKATYTAQGLLANLNTVKGNTTLRNMDFVFDNAAGTLTSRTGMMPQKESFAYDNLYRLTKVTAGSNVTDMNYGTGANTGKGNIYSKTGLGAYEYGSERPHAVTEVANSANYISQLQQDITYTDFQKVKTIGENGYLLDIDYGPDRQRVKTTLKHNNSIKKTVIFAGNYERITRNDTVTHLYYIAGGEGLSGIYVKQTKGATTLKDGMYYVHPDHLGSLTVITDASGAIKQKSTFDAWGKRAFVTKDNSLVFDRGFTGHEHLEEFSLINMNGRMYDPVLGRFLSPDPFVQNPLFSQSFNRYSYAWNNPLVYTDPDGEWVWLVFAVYGAITTGMKAGVAAQDRGGDFWKDGFWKGAIAGFASGAIGAGIGYLGTSVLNITGAIPGGLWGAFGGALGGGISGGLVSNAYGNSFSEGFWNGAMIGGYSV